MIAEISERRNTLEPKIRRIIRLQLQSSFGEGEARNKILSVLSLDDKKKLSLNGLSYRDYLDPHKVPIYFEDLRKIIMKEWDIFKHIFGPDQDRFNTSMKAINEYRIDAHAKEITDAEMKYVRVCFDKVEELVKNYLD